VILFRETYFAIHTPVVIHSAMMSQRIDPSWIVFDSVENAEHDRCVDFFSRPDGTFGFEEFRRDVEDRGAWTPVDFYSWRPFADRAAAEEAARKAVVWLSEALGDRRAQ
jgi:hypothetical protein